MQLKTYAMCHLQIRFSGAWLSPFAIPWDHRPTKPGPVGGMLAERPRSETSPPEEARETFLLSPAYLSLHSGSGMIAGTAASVCARRFGRHSDSRLR